MQPGIDLVQRIQQLAEERRRYAQAIQAIDEVLSQVSMAIEDPRTNLDRPVPTLPPGDDAAAAAHRGRVQQTGTRAVLLFIASRGNPTTAEINAHWRAEGRRGFANVILLKLIKQGLIRRQPDPDSRGSRYVVTPAGRDESQAASPAATAPQQHVARFYETPQRSITLPAGEG
jgi:hypothetical protein